MIEFMLGLISGGILGSVIMAVCAVSGRGEECRECREATEMCFPVRDDRIIYGETTATPTDPSKLISPDNPQTLRNRMVTRMDLGAIAIAKEMESGGDI